MDSHREIELKLKGLGQLVDIGKTFNSEEKGTAYENKVRKLEQKIRTIELREYLKLYGLVLRKDSYLENAYINNGEFKGDMKNIVDLCKSMYHAEFLHKIVKPFVGKDHDSLTKAGKAYNIELGERPEFNAKIEAEAVEEFMKICEPDTDKTEHSIADAIKFIISHSDKFDLSKVVANTTEYPSF